MPLQGGVNRLFFPPICFAGWHVHACVYVSVVPLGLWLGSFPGVSLENVGGGEGRRTGGGQAEDNCFLPIIHPESKSFEKLTLPLLPFAV